MPRRGNTGRNCKTPITQQQANEFIWNYYIKAWNNTIDMKKEEWNEFTSSIREDINISIKNIEEGVVNAANDAVLYIGTKIEDTRDKLSQNEGTISVKTAVNATALFGVYLDIGVSCDWKGNVSLQSSYSVPGVNDTVSVGLLDAGASIGIALTDAKDVNGLLGPSSAIGASGGYLGYGAIHILSFEDMSDMNGDMDGLQIGIGFGIGADIHLTETYTNEIFKYNIFDILLYFLEGESGCGE